MALDDKLQAHTLDVVGSATALLRHGQHSQHQLTLDHLEHSGRGSEMLLYQATRWTPAIQEQLAQAAAAANSLFGCKLCLRMS